MLTRLRHQKQIARRDFLHSNLTTPLTHIYQCVHTSITTVGPRLPRLLLPKSSDYQDFVFMVTISITVILVEKIQLPG